ncbi:hypothetical protein [Nocardia spumae]|uniref:hypothetical protein n=1 Tax=Nocardia spumae TaxID=2887190 RepID=UPI001D14622A|nr:hypothetical protein [Nocardia spumae]
MTLHLTDWEITSDTSPESALRLPDASGHWMLTWLPGELLTREQALSGMVVDEILSDPALVDDLAALDLAGLHAAELGIDVEDAIIRLSVRLLERSAEQDRPQGSPAHHGAVSLRRPRAADHDLSGTPS